MYDSVAVYADSAGVGEKQAALGLADDVLVLGKTQSEAYSDSMYVWCRIELNDGRQGWVKRGEIALTYYVVEVKEDSVIVRTQPDVSSDSVRVVFGGTFATVYERILEENQNWLKLKFYSRGWVEGWIQEQVSIPHPEGVVADLARSYLWGYGPFFGENRPRKDLDKALVVVERLKERDTEYLHLTPELEGVNYIVGLKAEAQWLKHWVLRKMGRFDEAIEALREIVACYPEQDMTIGRADGLAGFEIAEIYRSEIGDMDRAIEEYHSVISNYPDFPISGFEWNDWIDIRAAWRIIDILEESGDADQLLIESQRILEENDSDAVALLGYLGRATAFRMQGSYAEVEKAVIEGLASVQEAYRTYFKSGEDYPIILLSYGIETYMNVGDFRSALALCSKIGDEYAGLPVGSYAQLSIAEIRDRTIGDLDEVIESYQKVAMDTTNFNYNRRTAQRRLEALQEVIPEIVVVEDENVWIRVTGKESAEGVKELSQGEVLTLFYGDSGLSRDGDLEGFWQKVKTGDGLVGWILDAHLERNIEPIFNRGAAISVWSMLGGGPRHAPVFSGEKMERPQVIRQIPNVYAQEILFWDVNGDEVLDLIIPAYEANAQISGAESVVVLDGANQRILWRMETEGRINFTPAIGDSVLYLLLNETEAYRIRSQYVVALRLSDGEELWRFETGVMDRYESSYQSSPIFADGRVIFGSRDGYVYALNSVDGSLIWKTKTGEDIRSTPATDGSQVIIGSEEGDLYALDAQSGEIRWSFPTGYSILSIPSMDDEAVYIGGREGVVALRLEDGVLKWEFETSQEIRSTPLPADSSVFVGTTQGVFALDRDTGEQRWTFGTPLSSNSSPILVGDFVYISSNNQLFALSAESGKFEWTLGVEGSALLYQSGLLFCIGWGKLDIIGSGPAMEQRDLGPLPAAFALWQNRPNPFNSETLIQYDLIDFGDVEVAVYNPVGQRIRTLVRSGQSPGTYVVPWDGKDQSGRDVASGVYFYRITANSFSRSRKMTLIR